MIETTTREATTTAFVVKSNGLRNDHKLLDVDSPLYTSRVFPASMYGLVNWIYSERDEVMAKAAAAKSVSYTTNNIVCGPHAHVLHIDVFANQISKTYTVHELPHHSISNTGFVY